MLLSPEEQVNMYRVDSEVSDNMVRHPNPGVTVPGCQGIWRTTGRLDSEHGDSVVEVQCLESPQENPRLQPPRILRAVKRLRTQQIYPAVDNKVTIARGLLCMARANVSSCCILVFSSAWLRIGVARLPRLSQLYACCAGMRMLRSRILRWSTAHTAI